MQNGKRNRIWSYIVADLLLCALIGGIVYATVLMAGNNANPSDVSASDFAVGGLDENGKYVETKESIYTKDAFGCQGLTVVPEFESQGTYQIFFYDELGNFVSKTDVLEKSFSEDIDIFTTHARIVITPNEDEDGNAIAMNVFNKSKYAEQLTIKVNKEQKGLPKKYTYDYSGATATYNDFSINAGGSYRSSSEYELTSYTIDLSTVKQHYSKVVLSGDGENIIFAFVTEEPILKSNAAFATPETKVLTAGTTFWDGEIPADAIYLIVESHNSYGGTLRDRTPDILFYN